MAANRFATMLHKNTHRMAFLLIYTVLEWILISLLFISAFFSYFIAKFASFFSLKPPCIFCTRVDHLFQPCESRISYKDLICDSHAGEISKLGFCFKHRRLSQADDMCADCATAEIEETDRKAALMFRMKRRLKEEKDLLCSCCGVVHDSLVYSSYSVLQTEPSDVLDCEQKNRSIKDERDEFEREILFVCDERIEEDKEGFEKEGDSKGEILLSCSCDLVEDEMIALPLEKIVDEERIFSLELIDSSTMMGCPIRGQDVNDDILLEKDATEQEYVKIGIGEIAEEQSFVVLSEETEERHKICTVTDEPSEDVSFDGCNVIPQEDIHVVSVPVIKAEEFGEQHEATEEESKLNEEVNCEISIGSDICDQEHIEHAQIQESILEPEFQSDQSLERFNETVDREKVAETEPSKRTVRQVKHLAIPPVLNEIVEEGIPETPTTPYFIEGFPVLPKRFLLERRESGTESLDGSIASDLDNVEPLTLDRLKAALKAERKSLIALYAELEEERNASAIAANQTMAMITRLQEEKAAMQLEALHYQRMMEEQSEYDQEALQVLNELLMKREKEKQELEEELDLYNEKVLMYEAKEKNKKTRNNDNMRGIATGLSSSEDSDDLLSDFHEGEESNCSPHENKENTSSVDILRYGENTDILDVCLSEFEDNRLSILKQLKELLEKLFNMDDEDANNDLETTTHCSIENGHGVNGECKLLGDDIQCQSVDCSSPNSQTNGKLFSKQRSVGYHGKSLLPLFDAISLVNDEKLSTIDNSINGSSPDSVAKFAVDQKKLAILEELDQVHKRLQALEEDRDLMKHCISSFKKGKKGMNLLQEILQNLHDLRKVQLDARNYNF